MSKIGAVYCVYEDSGFLEESIQRIYSLMDKVVILIGFKPWNGIGNPESPKQTYNKCIGMHDPDKKIEIVSRVWATEHDQRNFGLDYLRNNGIDWCFIIDDDEMYNIGDLKKQLNEKILNSPTHTAFLTPHQIYWKRTDLVIENIQGAMPAFAKTTGQIRFTDARSIVYNSGEIGVFHPQELVCHHYSYVRTDEQMLRKIAHFSHASPKLKTWYGNVWMQWTLDMENISPNGECPSAYRKAIPAHQSPFVLEEYQGPTIEKKE